MAGTAMGVQGLIGQVGASWAGAPVGFVAQHWGWGAIRHLWAASLLASAGLLSAPGLIVKARRAAERHRGKEGPLIKLFNYYIPPEEERMEALRAAQAARVEQVKGSGRRREKKED
ncbi:Major facilitator superfamily domain, general substrate transporter [Nannochloropsis gaditana]|nr:Major facilitator superfamily domain, general substrate transporter [Nannochloropsis gaditana]